MRSFQAEFIKSLILVVMVNSLKILKVSVNGVDIDLAAHPDVVRFAFLILGIVGTAFCLRYLQSFALFWEANALSAARAVRKSSDVRLDDKTTTPIDPARAQIIAKLEELTNKDHAITIWARSVLTLACSVVDFFLPAALTTYCFVAYAE